jgi:vancomycin resistance protein YoaR
MAVTSVTEERPQRLRRMRILPRRFVMAVLAMFVVVALPVLAAFAFDRLYAGRVLPGVSVAGVDVSGLTAGELMARLQALPVAPESVEIVTGASRVSVASTDLGRRVDVDGAVAAALAAGRVAGPLADVPERFAMWRDGRPIDLATSVDRSAVAAWVAVRAEELRVTAVSAQIVATRIGWAATLPREGQFLDEATAVKAIDAALANRTAATALVELPMTAVPPRVDSADAERAIAAARRMVMPLTVNFRDDATWTIPMATLRAGIGFEDGADGPVPVINTDVLTPTLTGIAKDIARPANETMILRSRSGKTFGFVPGKNGRNVDIAATAGQIADVLAERSQGSVEADAPAPVVLSVLPPELSAAEAAMTTHQVSLVGAWTTRFVSSEKNGFGNNIRIPARLINGTVVGPGQVFDFWGTVGPVTFARGFRMGGIIESGRTNPNGAIGGGICSASTTMFNAAIRAGYQVLERDQHSYYINRYPLGLDATVSKYHGKIAQNMRFRNDTANSLYIRGLSGPNWVRFEIYSVPNGRTVTFSRPAVSNVRKAIDTVVRTSSLKRGQTKRSEYPTNGMDVVVYRTVRNASGAVIHSDRWVSHYIRVDGVLLVGTG